MNVQDYDNLANKLIAKAHEIEQAKRPAYTIGSEDVLENFKSVAKRLGITDRQAVGVYMLKHVDAITAACKDPNIPQAEELEGRFADCINYLKLAWGVINEDHIVKVNKKVIGTITTEYQ